MRVVADSSVLIDILRGDASATRLIGDHVRAGNEVWGVVVTRTEVLAGMLRGFTTELTGSCARPALR